MKYRLFTKHFWSLLIGFLLGQLTIMFVSMKESFLILKSIETPSSEHFFEFKMSLLPLVSIFLIAITFCLPVGILIAYLLKKPRSNWIRFGLGVLIGSVLSTIGLTFF